MNGQMFFFFSMDFVVDGVINCLDLIEFNLFIRFCIKQFAQRFFTF